MIFKNIAVKIRAIAFARLLGESEVGSVQNMGFSIKQNITPKGKNRQIFKKRGKIGSVQAKIYY